MLLKSYPTHALTPKLVTCLLRSNSSPPPPVGMMPPMMPFFPPPPQPFPPQGVPIWGAPRPMPPPLPVMMSTNSTPEIKEVVEGRLIYDHGDVSMEEQRARLAMYKVY